MRHHRNTTHADALRLVRHWTQALPLAALVAVLALAPQLVGAYWVGQATFVLIYAIAGLGLMVLAGYTGLISIGHAAFFGVGAYVQALAVGAGLPFVVGLAAAPLLAAALGVVVGLPALRVKGIYLAIATLAFGFIVEEVFVRWESVTGGNHGILVPRPMLFGINWATAENWHYVTLACAILATWAVLNLTRSATGRAFVAVRDSEISAQSMGVNLAATKTTAFAVSAALVGLAGALYAHKIRFISPEQFGVFQSIDLLLIVVIGGLGSIHGAFFGAVVLIALPQLIAVGKDFLPPAIGQAAGLQAFVYGAILVLVVLYEPTGLYGRWRKIRAWFELFPFYRKGMFARQKSYQRSDRE